MDDCTLPLLGCITEVREQVYRVARISPGKYGVARVTDNVRVGTFTYSHGTLQVTAENVDVSVLAEVAAAAIRKGL